MEAVNYAIEVKNVGLKIKKDVILKGINVNFEKGKIHGIVGRNGCGKTILLVSHNSEDISILSDEIYYMDKGTMEKGKKSQV